MKQVKKRKVYDYASREVTIEDNVVVKKLNYRNLAIAIMLFIATVMILGLIILYLISRLVKII